MTTLTIPSLLEILREYSLEECLADRLDLTCPERQWLRLEATDDFELWLISWPAGAGTGWHDHGAASGAFTTLRGSLTEYTWDGVLHARTLNAGAGRAFGSSHVHDVSNESDWASALSLHAYTPRLTAMTRYELVRGHLEVTGVERAGGTW
jgi:hypothetical protein